MNQFDAEEDKFLEEVAQWVRKPKPFFDRYQLRWLFYLPGNNLIFGKHGFSSTKRCSKCKKGCSGPRMIFLNAPDDTVSSPCPHCGQQLTEEPNTNLDHLIYRCWKWIVKQFRDLLNWLHILRKRGETRYGIFGDEAMYASMTFSQDFKFTGYIHHPRRWWEYIFIARQYKRKL